MEGLAEGGGGAEVAGGREAGRGGAGEVKGGWGTVWGRGGGRVAALGLGMVDLFGPWASLGSRFSLGPSVVVFPKPGRLGGGTVSLV